MVPLSAEGLCGLLREKTQELLMLDVRSFMQFNQCHLQSSINVCIPTSLLKRKNFSLSCVESAIGCDKLREKWKNRQGADIVIYDSACDNVRKNCLLSTLVQKLKDESLASSVCFLNGKIPPLSPLPFLFLGKKRRRKKMAGFEAFGQ